jgi:hypothetical protein
MIGLAEQSTVRVLNQRRSPAEVFALAMEISR